MLSKIQAEISKINGLLCSPYFLSDVFLGGGIVIIQLCLSWLFRVVFLIWFYDLIYSENTEGIWVVRCLADSVWCVCVPWHVTGVGGGVKQGKGKLWTTHSERKGEEGRDYHITWLIYIEYSSKQFFFFHVYTLSSWLQHEGPTLS